MKTKEEFFEYEKQKQKIFDDYYKKKKYEVRRIFGIKNRDYDCEVKIGDNWYKIEEKYRSTDFNDCLVETIQDTKTNSPGWLYYTKADYILYGTGDKIYCIDFLKLKNFVESHKNYFNKIISKKGWGNTENIVIDWATLKINNIAEQVK